ncbi:hypothetical protein WJX77_008873 [Trebouxia sp. C0004]
MSSLPRSCQRVGKHLQSRVRTAPQKAYNKLVSCLGNDHSVTQDHVVTAAPELEDVASSQTTPSFSKDEYAAAIERQANSWRDCAAEMSSRFEVVKSELDLAVKKSALELDRHQRSTAEVEQLLSSARASAAYFERSAVEFESELTSKQALLKETEHAQDLLSSKLVSQEEDSSSIISALNTTIVELQDAASGFQVTLACKESAAAAADIKHKEELEALHLAHRAQTEKLTQIQAKVDREHRATKGELQHAETALAQQQNAVADAQAQVHLANQRVQELESDLTSSQQDSINITTELRSEVAHLKTLFEDTTGRTQEAQQQHVAAEAQSAAQLASLKTRMDTQLAALTSQLESEQNRRVAPEEQHKAAQDDLALASGLAEQLKSDQAVLLTQASKHATAINELHEQAAQFQTALKAAHTQSDEAAAVAQHAKAQQQQMDLDIAGLSSQLESERRRCAKAAIDHTAAQADLAEQLTHATGATQKLKCQHAELASQALKDAQTVKDFTDQAAQLRAALTAAHAKSAAARQNAQILQIIPQLNALCAEHAASVDNTKVVHADMEEAKLQISTLKAQLVMSHEAADSARAASDSLAQQMQKSADTELSKIAQQVDAAEAEARHLQGLLANTEADAGSEAAKLQLLLEKSQASAASIEQDVNRLEQQLARSQTAAAQQQEELKKLHTAELQSQARGVRRWEGLFGQAAQLRTNLQIANAKSEAEAQDAADYASAQHQQLMALHDSSMDLQEQLNRQSWRAQEAQARAEQGISKLQEQLAAAEASDESSQQDVKRLEQQLAGSQAAAAEKEQELATQVTLTQEQASKLQGQLETALVDLNSLPGVVRGAWFERNRIKAILEAFCDDRDHSHTHMVTQVQDIQKLVGALASSCKCVRSELRDAQVDHNRTNCMLEAALVEKDESQGQLEEVTKKYTRLKGQYDRALADLGNQQEHHNDALLDAEQPSDNAAAMANGQEDGDEQHPKKRGTRAGRVSRKHLDRNRNPGQQGDSDNVAIQLTDRLFVDDFPAVL